MLGEAYSGSVAEVLRKYRLLDAAGDLRVVSVAEKPTRSLKAETGPIVDPEVMDRLIALDPRGKTTLDWVIFASGGGASALRESESALQEGKGWMFKNRMEGNILNGDGTVTKIKPATREECEQIWKSEFESLFRDAYFYGDQELAADDKYAVFGWYMHWPGRNKIYDEIEKAVTKWSAMCKDMAFVREWNKSYPKDAFKPSLMVNGAPTYESVEALNAYLNEYLNNVRSKLAGRKAEKNVVTVGKNPEGGYIKGPAETFYEDAHLKVVIPLTAGASLKNGFRNWCIANRSHWNDYFKSRDRAKLYWGSMYTPKGPFAFFTFKQALEREPYTALVGWPKSGDETNPVPPPPLPMLAAHVQLRVPAAEPDRIDFWDVRNAGAISREVIENRIKAILPEALPSFGKAIEALEAWLLQFKEDELERFPALEAATGRMASNLVETLLAD